MYLNKKEPFCNLKMQNVISATGEIDVKEKRQYKSPSIEMVMFDVDTDIVCGSPNGDPWVNDPFDDEKFFGFGGGNV